MRVLRISHSAVVDAWRERERAVRRRGIDVTSLSAQKWNEGGAEIALTPRQGEPVSGLRTWGRHPALFVYDPRSLWHALGSSYDVIDIHEEPFALATAEILAMRRLRQRRTPYALYSAQNIDKRYPPPFRWLEHWALRHASCVSVCNANAAEIVQRKGFPGRASVIGLGLDRAHFQPDLDSPSSATTAAGADSPAYAVVGYAGRLEPHKGVDVLLEAVSADPRLRLRIAGGGPDAGRLHALVAGLHIGDRVEFLGSVAQADLPEFYRELDVLAVPSLTTRGWIEQFGRVAVEAMACGTPVVASDSGALPDVVGGAGLLVPPGDAAALRSALVKAALDPASADELRARGLERARAYDWDAIGDAYAELYRRAARETAPAGNREVEVVVVAYGAAEMLRQALEPLAELPVTVVDNSSSLQVRQVCSDLGVRYLDPGFNGGFAAGVNAALCRRRRPGADVLLLNPDAVITREAVTTLQGALAADPLLASVGPAQVDASGRPSRVGWPFPSPWRAWLEAVGLGRLRSRTDFAIGSVLLLRAEALDHVGTLDEGFFLYSEETDWAYRAARLGWRHAVVPAASATHVGAGTSRDAVRREIHFHASQERYLRKHFGALGWQAARVGQIGGSAARALLLRGARAQGARQRLSLYARGPLNIEQSLRSGPTSTDSASVL